MRSRAERRHHRDRMIQKAFDIFWNSHGYCNDDDVHGAIWQAKHHPEQYELVFADEHKEFWDVKEAHKEDTLLIAKKNADHLRNCSCDLCKRYAGEKALYDQKENDKFEAELQELIDILDDDIDQPDLPFDDNDSRFYYPWGGIKQPPLSVPIKDYVHTNKYYDPNAYPDV